MQVTLKAPPKILEPYIQHFFIGRPTAEDGPIARTVGRSLPDGSAQILYQEMHPEAVQLGFPSHSILLAGAHKNLCDFSAGSLRFMGAQIKPGALKTLMGIPASEVTDRLLPLESVWGAEGKRLLERMATENGDGQRLGLLVQAMVRRIWATRESDLFVTKAAKIIEGRQGRGPLAGLYELMGYSKRQVHRKFEEGMGLSPKQYARTVRLQSLFGELNLAQDPDWSGLATQYGYFDQAHLSHDFKRMTHRYPQQFIEEFRRYGLLVLPKAQNNIIVYATKPPDA